MLPALISSLSNIREDEIGLPLLGHAGNQMKTTSVGEKCRKGTTIIRGGRIQVL